MNARELREARARLGLSEAEMGRLFHVSREHVRRWESPKTLRRARDIPRGVEIAVRLLLDHGIPAWLAKEMKE